MRGDAPQRHEPPGSFGQLVIAGGRLLTIGALGGHGGMRFYVDLDAERVASTAQPNRPIHEARKVLNPVQEGLNLELNSWSPGWLFIANRWETSSDHRRPAISSILCTRWLPCWSSSHPLAQEKRHSICRGGELLSPSSRRLGRSSVNKSAEDLFKRPRTPRCLSPTASKPVPIHPQILLQSHFYKPLEGKWHLCIWDMDLGLVPFSDAATTDIFVTRNGFGNLQMDPVTRRIFSHPQFRRAYLRALDEIVNGIAPRLPDLVNAKHAAFGRNGVTATSPSTILNYLNSRRTSVTNQMRRYDVPFAVGTNLVFPPRIP